MSARVPGTPPRRLLLQDVLEHRSIFRAGAIAAAGVALSYLASATFAVMMPPELQGRPDVGPHQFWTVLSADPAAHLLFHWSWVVAGLCGLGAVPAICLLVWRASPGAVMWSGGAAFLGFAVLARSHLMEQAWDRRVIAGYANADPAYQQAVHVVAGLALDVPDGLLTYGAIGTWVAVVSVAALRTAALPRPLCWVGLATAGTYLAGVAGYGLQIRPLIVLSVGLGGFVLAPLWYGWLAMVLRRRAVTDS
ncbi:MAG TPA: hypothetical protein VEL28_11300 [Candidatus Binatia bacterium]|nr:hypothetical protein [Candidatus Binatia bacterium]